jgi:hypothetical protein
MLLTARPGITQTNLQANSTGSNALKPIEINYSTLTGLCYFHDGESLTQYKEFEDLIYPLKDFEASRLLKRSETSDFDAKIFTSAGFAGLVTGIVGLLTTSSKHQTGFWMTAVGGAILIDIGGLFQSEAQTSKFNCAQRYNRFARGEEQVLPQVPKDENSLLNFSKP